jgi:hypothetical protein
VLDIAPGHARGEALARLFLAACLGLAVPVLGLGLATQALSTPTALPGSPGAGRGHLAGRPAPAGEPPGLVLDEVRGPSPGYHRQPHSVSSWNTVRSVKKD